MYRLLSVILIFEYCPVKALTVIISALPLQVGVNVSEGHKPLTAPLHPVVAAGIVVNEGPATQSPAPVIQTERTQL